MKPFRGAARISTGWRLQAAPTGWITLFLLAPLLAILAISFFSRGPYGQVGLPLTLDNYLRLFGFGIFGFDPVYPLIIARSLMMGFLTALGCALLALPVVLFIVRLPARWRVVALTAVIIPFWTNLLVRTYAWQILLAPDSLLSHLLSQLHLAEPGASLYPSPFAVLAALICDFLPFFILPLYASVEKADWTLLEAVMDLGGNRWKAFCHGLWPQIKAGFLAGWILVFLPATGQFVVPDLLGGAKTVMLGNALQQQFGTSRDWPFGAAIAAVSLVVVMTAMWWYSKLGEPEVEP